MEKLEEEAKSLRREYQREYYKKNKEKRKKYNNDYWNRKARRVNVKGESV